MIGWTVAEHVVDGDEFDDHRNVERKDACDFWAALPVAVGRVHVGGGGGGGACVGCGRGG